MKEQAGQRIYLRRTEDKTLWPGQQQGLHEISLLAQLSRFNSRIQIASPAYFPDAKSGSCQVRRESCQRVYLVTTTNQIPQNCIVNFPKCLCVELPGLAQIPFIVDISTYVQRALCYTCMKIFRTLKRQLIIGLLKSEWPLWQRNKIFLRPWIKFSKQFQRFVVPK